MTRRTWLAALGVAAAALVVGVCVTVAYALSTGFDRAARQADLPDVLVRFDAARRGDVDARLRTLPGLEARSYRLEATDVDLRHGRDATGRGAVHVVQGGRRGYAVVAGHDVRSRDADVVVEQGLARTWGLRPGSRLDVGGLGTLRVAGVALSPDNVAYPVASAARVYVGRDELRRAFGPGEFGVSLAQLWLAPGASVDVALAQARAQSFGVRGLSFITRSGVRTVVGQAAGIVVALLVAFSLVALGAAAAMLGTAAHADVRRRLPALAVRRALGFPRAALARAAAARAARIAVPAAAVGLAAGWAAARGPAASLLATLNEASPGAAVAWPLALGLVGVVGLVVACTTWPAWRATAGAPAALLRGGELAGRRGGRRRGSAGSRPALLGARVVATRRARFAGTVAVVGTCAAVVLLMLALASLLERLRDDPATLGKRYALTVSADPSQLSVIEDVPGVAAATPRWQLRAAASFTLGDELRLVAMPGDHVPFEAPPLAAGRRLASDREAEVGVGLADALGLAPGGTLGVQLPDGAEARFRVAGVVRALDNDGRIAYVRPVRIARALGFTPNVAVKLDPGADRAAVARRLTEHGYPPRRTAGAAGRNGRLLGVLGDVLRVVAGAVGLVVLYALAQALALTAAERRPTLALLRSLGASPRTVALVLAGAGAAIVVPAAVIAVVLERLLLAPLVAGLAADYAELPLAAGAGQVALVAGGLLVLASAAALWVARRVRREPIAPALRAAALAVLVVALAGCGRSDPPRGVAPAGDTRVATLADRDGDGRLERAPGEPLVARGGRAGRTVGVLATFGQITDAHVRDEESPARVPFLDRLGAPFASTFRPQEALTAQTLAAIVGPIDALRPDAVVVTGDLADNAQANELRVARTVLRGGVVRPDSGAPGPSGPQLASDPDPFFYRPDVDAPRHPGLLARAQRPFRSAGLRAPWRFVPGNHDLLVQGELAPDARTRAVATGDGAVVRLDVDRLRGLRLRSDTDTDTVARALRGGRRVRVAPDPARREVTSAELAAPPAFDLGPRVRGIALDLVRRRGGSEGEVTPAVLARLRDGLARAGDRPIVVFSHQPLDRSAGGDAALDLLEHDPRVIAAVAGHTHRNAIRRRGRLWLITTASLVDYPQQARAFRLVRTAGGGLALETWMLDHDAGPGGLATISRDLAFLDAQGGRPNHFAGRRPDRNARLTVPFLR